MIITRICDEDSNTCDEDSNTTCDEDSNTTCDEDSNTTCGDDSNTTSRGLIWYRGGLTGEWIDVDIILSRPKCDF